jgi:hypothetical protein
MDNDDPYNIGDPFGSPTSSSTGATPKSTIKGGRASFGVDSSAVRALSSAFSGLRQTLTAIVSLLQQTKTLSSGLGNAAKTLNQATGNAGGAPGAGGSTNSYLNINQTPGGGVSSGSSYLNIPKGGYVPSARGVTGPFSALQSYGQAAYLNSSTHASNAYNNNQGGYLSSAMAGVRAFGGSAAGGGGLGSLGRVGMGAFVAQQVGQAASGMIQPVNDRITRGYTYSLAADKMTVLYQQMTGMSGEQVRANYREPLTNYRIGSTGINDLMGMQSQTGLSALQQAGSVESLRTMSGYGLSSQDATRMITSMADPAVVNRMFMMTGTSMVGIGGKQNSAMSVIQQMSKLIGVKDERTGNDALVPGSITRARLASFGLSPEMQTQVIQYAMHNSQFKKKGGSGLLDYTNEEHRKAMGIEDSFATQVEETTRTKGAREEDFYDAQARNFAELEKKTQAITEAFGKLEEALSGIIGTKIANQPIGNLLGGIGGAAGMVLTAAGFMSLASPLAPIAPLLIGGGLGLTALSGFAKSGTGTGAGDSPQTSSRSAGNRTSTGSTRRSGNASSLDPNMRIPGAGGTVGGLMKDPTFTKLHPEMQQRVMGVIGEAKGQVGISNGWRSSDQQAGLFFGRYRRTGRKDRSVKAKDGDMWYQGEWWEKKNPSDFDTAPPGNSFHEIGLAVDFQGDLALASNIGKKYGLRTFENINNELHHAQPEEVETSWSKYVQGGYKWGAPTGGGADPGGSSTPGSDLTDGGGGYGIGGVRKVSTHAEGTTLSQMILSGSSMAASFGGSDTGVSAPSQLDLGQATTTGSMSGALSAEDLVKVFQRNGFTGSDLTKAVGISWRESRWNPRAHNPRGRDNSYGLMQINMIDIPAENYFLGESRRKRYGISNEDLFDPDTNARVARDLVGDGGGWTHWRPGKEGGGSLPETYGTDMAWAAAVVGSVNSGRSAPAGHGDAPVSSSRAAAVTPSPAYGAISAPTSVTNAVVRNGDYNITIAPTINMSGGPNQGNLEKMAKEIGTLLEKEVKRTLMRTT